MSMRYPGGLIATTPVNQQYPSGVWTGPQTTPYQANNVWANDSSFKNTTLLLHGDGATTSFTKDASTNNFQLTLNGDTRPNNLTPFVENGYWSNYFDGSGDTLNTASNSAFGFGSGAWTFEAWVYPTVAQTDNWIIATNDAGKLRMRVGASGYLSFFTDTGSISLNSTTVVTVNAWSHVAICYDGTTLSLFQNGTRTATSTVSISNGSANACYIGSNTVGGGYWNGYISNARVVKGSAVYSGATYTVPTTPLTAVSGTSLLTCQSNRFVDNSTNAFTLTVTGNTAVSMQQPFTAPSGTSLFGSGYFDGDGDSITAPANSAFAFGTGDFTYEGWYYSLDTGSSLRGMFDTRITQASTAGVLLREDSSGFLVYINGGTLFTASGRVPNSWQHIALVRQSGTIRLYINGVQANSAANTTNFTDTFCRISGFVDTQASPYGYFGYISNARVIKGTCLYPSGTTFTPSTTPLTPVSGTSLLTLQTNGPENNNGFLDNSPNSFPVIRTGNTTQGSFTPYEPNGYWSTYFTGSSTYLYFANNAALSFGTGDFCVEAYVYKQRAANEPIIDSRSTNNASPWAVYIDGSNLPYFYDGTSYTSTIPITLNAWNHVAVTRSSGTLRIFINGVQGYSATVTTNLDRSGGNQVIGATVTTFANSWSGYMSNFRIVKGSAVYTSAFTPPTSPLTAISGTSLLTFQSNRFVDNSSNAFTFTIVGSPSVQNFQPFTLPALQYTPQVFGGSAYFDGSGDRISITGNSAFDVSSGNFTVEGWVYPTSNANIQGLFVLFTTTNVNYGGLTIYVSRNTNSTITFECASPSIGGNSPAVGITTTNIVPMNAWSHVAATRSGNTFTIWINGVSSGTATFSGTLYWSPPNLYLGSGNDSTANRLTGYISNFRLVKGTAVYTSAFTPPSSPVTAISGTQVLTNFADAAIFDNSGTSNLETVGNAQIDTSVAKYGPSSMYFDGTGDWLKGSSGQSVPFGTESFTVECWINLSNLSSTKGVMYGIGTNSLGFRIGQGYLGNVNGLNICRNQVTDLDYCAYTFAVNTWYHIAVVRSGTSILFFVNGVQQTTLGSGAGSYSFTAPSGYYVGCNDATTEPFAGYIDDLRITRGVARYVTNFTPPVARMPNQ